MITTDKTTVPLSSYRELEARYQQVQQELQWLERQLFGQKSKRFITDDAQRHNMRQDIMAQEFAAFRQWMLNEVGNNIPSSPLRKAMEYALGQWPGFNAFLEDGRVELSNNWVENVIRPVALGRRIICLKDLNLQLNVVQLFTPSYRLQN